MTSHTARIALTTLVVIVVGGTTPGCETPGSGIQAGEHVTVYVSMPLRGPEAVEGRDVVRAAKLALADAQGRVGELAVRAVYLDDTGGRGARARWSQAVAAANARDAAEDSSAIAYLGDFDSGATRASLPITNEARMLQVSPASAAVDLVQPFLGAGDQVPEEVQATGERTFGRVIPSDEVQAEAAAGWAKRLGARRVGTVSDGSEFGQTMVRAFRQSLQGTRLTRGRGDLLYYGGGPERMPASLTQSSTDTVMASDALLMHSPSGPVRGVLVTSAAEDPSQLPRAGERFVSAFTKRYGRQPGRYAAYGYEAMSVVLDSIQRAGDQGDDRDAVVDAFFDTQDRDSVLGTYSIDEVGDTTLGRLAGYLRADGRPRFKTALRVP
ncbi:MAG: branched-chain amino acid ABC transporter substrate-binding protein [Actinomycetota bacterium]